jgi:membrane protease YdiL (CAAX protease family)
MLSSKPWRAEAVIFFIAAQFLCFFAGAIAIFFLHHFSIGGFRKPDDFGNILLATLCFQGATWILIPILLRLTQTDWREAFGLHKNIFHSFVLAVGVLIVILPIALVLEHWSVLLLEKTGWHPEEEAAVELISKAQMFPVQIYLGIFAVVIAPVAEEFIFRGVLYPFVKQLGFPKLALFGVSALFALIHFGAAFFIPLFVLALAFTWLYEKTGSLLAPIFAHSLFNAANLVILAHQLKHE